MNTLWPKGWLSDSGFFKVVQWCRIVEYNVSWTALHSVHLPQTYDSSFELWAPCVNNEAQRCGAAAGWKSFSGSVYLWCCRRERRTLHTFEGHCTSKNGASPELTLIKAPVLETSVWATAGKTGDSQFFTVELQTRNQHCKLERSKTPETCLTTSDWVTEGSRTESSLTDFLLKVSLATRQPCWHLFCRTWQSLSRARD